MANTTEQILQFLESEDWDDMLAIELLREAALEIVKRDAALLWVAGEVIFRTESIKQQLIDGNGILLQLFEEM